MTEVTSCCAICRATEEDGKELVERPLVPREFLSAGLFEIDPLGTGGAAVRLCPACAATVAAPMMVCEDVEAFARAVELHQETYPPTGVREGQAARMRLWHRALHLGLRALVTELEQRQPASPTRAEPDQMGLFGSKAARLAKVEAALAGGRLEEARVLSEELVRRFDLREARYLASRLGPVAAQVDAARGDAAALAALAGQPEGLLDFSRITVSLASAFTRGLHRMVALAAEEHGRGGLVAGRPVGWHWLRAGERSMARSSLEETVRKGGAPGLSLILLGNIAFELDEIDAARESYRRAFCEDPESAPVEEIADEAVQELVADAEALGLAPAAEWVPMVGYWRGLFELPPRAEGRNGCRDFHAALLEARHTRDPGARQRMEALAPELAERLRADRRA